LIIEEFLEKLNRLGGFVRVKTADLASKRARKLVNYVGRLSNPFETVSGLSVLCQHLVHRFRLVKRLCLAVYVALGS
jgi:hypothetical protein